MVGKKRAGAIPPELGQLRESIDNIDAALIYLLAERFRCTRRVGELKATSGMPAGDPVRMTRSRSRSANAVLKTPVRRFTPPIASPWGPWHVTQRAA